MIRMLARRGGWVLCVLAAISIVRAGERVHRVQPGESASAIAKRYYGDLELAELLLQYNGKPGTVIRVGETLRIPDSPQHTVRRGDTWSVLAKRYMDRPEAWASVARLNGMLPERPLQVGQRIVFPALHEHRLSRGETLAILAQRFYGDTELAAVLQEFNRIDDPRQLSVGQSIVVPLIAFRLQQDRPVPEAAAEPVRRAAPPPDPVPAPAPPRFSDPLRSVRLALARGDFLKAREILAEIRTPVQDTGSESDQAELWSLLAFVHVAYDEEEQACEALHTLAALRDPASLFDPDLVSPKIRRTFSRCKSRPE